MRRTGPLFIKYVGSSSLASLPTKYASTVEAASKAMESEYPKVVEAKIQGSYPHKSSRDQNDDKEVITVSYHTATGTRVTSIHAHDDSTWNEFPSRNAFKGK